MPNTNYGTLITLDTLASITGTTVLQFGEDRIYDAIATELEIVNAQLAEVMGQFVEQTTDRLRRGYGTQTDMAMIEVDEMGTPDAQKYSPPGQNIGFPLRRFQIALQWTRSWFERATPREVALQAQAAIRADTKNMYRLLKVSLFRPSNYTFKDRWVDNISIPVKALVNADGMPLPFGPNDEIYNGGTHTHYLATASLVAADIVSLWKHVAEHYAAGEIRIYINQAQEAAVRAMTSNFVAFTDARLINPVTSTQADQRLTSFNQSNRAIGLFDQAVVWVKPWVPAGYMFAYNAGAGVRAPLALRRSDTGTTDFRLVFEDEEHPLRARIFEREFGLGVQERTNGAVLYIGGGAYVQPTIP